MLSACKRSCLSIWITHWLVSLGQGDYDGQAFGFLLSGPLSGASCLPALSGWPGLLSVALDSLCSGPGVGYPPSYPAGHSELWLPDIPLLSLYLKVPLSPRDLAPEPTWYFVRIDKKPHQTSQVSSCCCFYGG